MPVPGALPYLFVIEDNQGDITLLREAVAECSEPVDLLAYDDPEEALARLTMIVGTPGATLPALILTDLNMPRRNGFSLIAALRALPALAEVPILVLSSSRRETDAMESLKLGAAGFLNKPSDWEGFRRLVPALRRYWKRR